jgi:hypothetical protein
MELLIRVIIFLMQFILRQFLLYQLLESLCVHVIVLVCERNLQTDVLSFDLHIRPLNLIDYLNRHENRFLFTT